MTSESSKQYTFDLKYKGEQSDLGEIKQFKYGYKGTSGGSTRTEEGPVRWDMLHMGDMGMVRLNMRTPSLKSLSSGTGRVRSLS